MGQVTETMHAGRKIIHIDFSRIGGDELLKAIEEAQSVIATQSPSSALTLTNVTDVRYNKTITERLKAYVAHNKPYVKAGAVVGLNDMTRIIFNSINMITGRNLKAFSTVEEARTWLAGQ